MMVVLEVEFVLMVRKVEMELHRPKHDKNYWQPIKFSCPARKPYKLQNALNDLALGDYVTVIAEKGENKEWDVTDIEFAKYKATDFRKFIALNEEIL